MLPMQKRLLRAAILVRDLAEVGAKRGRVKMKRRRGERREKEEGALFSVVRGSAGDWRLCLSSRFGYALLPLLFFDFFNFSLT